MNTRDKILKIIGHNKQRPITIVMNKKLFENCKIEIRSKYLNNFNLIIN